MSKNQKKATGIPQNYFGWPIADRLRPFVLKKYQTCHHYKLINMKPIAILPVVGENIVAILSPENPEQTDVWIYLLYAQLRRNMHLQCRYSILTDGSVAYGFKYHYPDIDNRNLGLLLGRRGAAGLYNDDFPPRGVVRRMIREGVKQVM